MKSPTILRKYSVHHDRQVKKPWNSHKSVGKILLDTAIKTVMQKSQTSWARDGMVTGSGFFWGGARDRMVTGYGRAGPGLAW